MLYNVCMEKLLTLSQVADMLTVTKETLRRWDASGKLVSIRHPINGYRMYKKQDLKQFEQLGFNFNLTATAEEEKPIKKFKTVELFAGAGGLAIGLEKAGLKCVMLNEIDKNACETLRLNRPDWQVIEGDVSKLDFLKYAGKIDLLTGGFPCQAFSYAGKRLGFEDARGTLFYEFARAVKEIQPLIALGENVRGLINHAGGKTLEGMISVLEELGYDVVPPQVLKAIFYNVPQKRERLLIVAIKRGTNIKFEFPTPNNKILTIKDALKKGVLYKTDVPESAGQKYPKEKYEVMSLVPPGGYWRDLPVEVQKTYMKKSFYLTGGRTGMARRMSWLEPSLTLTCAPAQNQTERCHPQHTRPFTVREYARIQTFPDEWTFSGSLGAQYKQIGNAVPVNLAYAVGKQLVRALNGYYKNKKRTRVNKGQT